VTGVGLSQRASWNEKQDKRSQTMFVFHGICLDLKWILYFKADKSNLRTNFIIILSWEEVLLIISATAALSVKNKNLMIGKEGSPLYHEPEQLGKVL
jgi:uncharacterized membrane protein